MRFPDRPATTLPELQRDVLQLFYQLGALAEGNLIRDVEISSDGTKLAHGLRAGAIPRTVVIIPKAQTDGPPYPYQQADNRLVYLQAVPTTVVGAFAGGIGAGGRTLPVANIGDTVQLLVDMTTGDDASGDFEEVITQANEIQQTGGTYLGILVVLRRTVTVNCDVVVVP